MSLAKPTGKAGFRRSISNVRSGIFLTNSGVLDGSGNVFGPPQLVQGFGRVSEEEMTVLLALIALQIKHCFADFVWQSAWMIDGKGRYGHPGGIMHAGLHAVLTCVILTVLGVPPGWSLALIGAEFVVHYHIDYLKALTGRRLGLATDDPRFWSHLGYDQLAHHLTYIAIAAVLVSFSLL